MRRRRGDAQPTPARAPVEATATFRSSQPIHGLVAFVLARIVRPDGSFILARGASVPDALRRGACAVEREQAVGPLGTDPRRLALAALRQGVDVLWNGEQSDFGLIPTLDKMKGAIAALEAEISFDVEHDLEQVRFHREEVPRG